MDLNRTKIMSKTVEVLRLGSFEDLMARFADTETGAVKPLCQWTDEEVEQELRDHQDMYSDMECECGLQQGTEHEGHHHPECPDWDGHNG